MSLSVIILAAGKGTRMKSARPKVIHPLAGKPMLQHVVDTSRKLQPEQILLVIGHEAEMVRDVMREQDLLFVEQQQQLGTGHAVMQCSDQVKAGNDILVLYGDVPLISDLTLEEMIKQGQENVVCLLSFYAANPTGYGRIIRDDSNHVTAIVEEKDASEREREIQECNSGIIFIKGSEYQQLLADIDNDNAQQEYYLTDVVKHAVTRSHPVAAVLSNDEQEVLGVNNQQQLAQLEHLYRLRRADELMRAGAKLTDPQRIDIRGNVRVGRDVSIDVNCVFEGEIELGDGVQIGANCVLVNSSVGSGSQIHPMSIIENSEIGSDNSIGPFARIRPDSKTLENARIGNFVEVKKSVIGQGSKVNHLSYIGDTEMGADVNIGAGTITCN